MIHVSNNFGGSNLKIKFSGENIEEKMIIVSIDNDVNFKPLIEYLIDIIPLKTKLNSHFDNYQSEEKVGKFRLIEETINEIFLMFNQSLLIPEDQCLNEVTLNVADNKFEIGDLPF